MNCRKPDKPFSDYSYNPRPVRVVRLVSDLLIKS